MMSRSTRCLAFTLIELLIVVAIIAILAAIAVPNFLEAQTRSKVARVKADMRTAATGLEAYCVDHNNYPWPLIGYDFIAGVFELTTPVAYLTSVKLNSPFFLKVPLTPDWDRYRNEITYYNYNGRAVRSWSLDPKYWRKGYCITSWGPSGIQTASCFLGISDAYPPGTIMIDRLYDPSNGTVSPGEIGYFGGSATKGGLVN